MPIIENYKVYNERMEAGIKDKLWFVDNLLPEINTIVDFGCADCALGRALEHYYPNQFRYIGIDNDPRMRELGAEKGFTVVDMLAGLYPLNIDYDKTVIVFSSVMHELLSYCGRYLTTMYLKEVAGLGFKQIAIRDMSAEYYVGLEDKIENIEGIIKDTPWFPRYKNFIDYCKENREDESNWSLEFFLKYNYSENWQREKEERYLWNWEEITFHILHKAYDEDYNCTFRIPYQVRKIRKDFGFTIPLDTHRKVLYTRKEGEKRI